MMGFKTLKKWRLPVGQNRGIWGGMGPLNFLELRLEIYHFGDEMLPTTSFLKVTLSYILVQWCPSSQQWKLRSIRIPWKNDSSWCWLFLRGFHPTLSTFWNTNNPSSNQPPAAPCSRALAAHGQRKTPCLIEVPTFFEVHSPCFSPSFSGWYLSPKTNWLEPERITSKWTNKNIEPIETPVLDSACEFSPREGAIPYNIHYAQDA